MRAVKNQGFCCKKQRGSVGFGLTPKGAIRAIAFNQEHIKHIYFVAETKGYDKDSLKDYRRAESVKIECASRHFATISDSHVTYDVVKNYDELWDIITKP